MDARRNSDGAEVMIKRCSKRDHPFEAEIGRFFCSEPLASDPRNRCIPIYEVLQAPRDDDLQLIVMPRLRKFGSPRFETIGEIVEFLRQVFEVRRPSNWLE